MAVTQTFQYFPKMLSFLLLFSPGTLNNSHYYVLFLLDCRHNYWNHFPSKRFPHKNCTIDHRVSALHSVCFTICTCLYKCHVIYTHSHTCTLGTTCHYNSQQQSLIITVFPWEYASRDHSNNTPYQCLPPLSSILCKEHTSLIHAHYTFTLTILSVFACDTHWTHTNSAILQPRKVKQG